MNQYANDFTSTVRIYYDELKKYKYKPISKAKERRLLKQCKRGNLKAKNELLEANLRFVFDIARHYTGRGVPISDLISEGNMGLLKAIEKFDDTKDVKFISYAVWWIRQAMTDAIKRKKSVTFVEIEPNESNDSVIDSKIIDEDDEISETKDTTYTNEYDEKAKEVSENQKAMVSKIISILSERERNIIESYYGINNKKELTLVDIGKKYNLTSERVRQIKLSAIRKLRSKIMLCNDCEDLFV
jgi:RNA polymerase primary sigma factor